MITPPRRLVWVLWALLFAFCCRVLGQALVAFLDVSWLPPMEEWYSGLMAYPLLLPTQLLIIAIYTKVCWDFTRGDGNFVQVRPMFGRGVLWFGYVYWAAMARPHELLSRGALVRWNDPDCLPFGIGELHHRLWTVS